MGTPHAQLLFVVLMLVPKQKQVNFRSYIWVTMDSNMVFVGIPHCGKLKMLIKR